MKNRNGSSDATLGQKFFGFLILVAIGWFGFGYLFGGSGSAPAQDPNMTLEAYKKLSQEQRAAYISDATSDLSIDDSDINSFVSCMGDFAFNKNPSLRVAEVLGWCDTERVNNPEKFAGHFNELRAGDLSSDASIVCKDYVRATLKAPSTADFPLLDFSATRHAAGRWTVSSYVDAENSFGATIRSRYLCDIQYAGKGDPLDYASWQLLDLKVN